MIICKRPVPIYDVDLIGGVAVAFLAALSYFGVAAPSRARAVECANLASSIALSEDAARKTTDYLQRVEAEMKRLNAGLAQQKQRAPSTATSAALMARIVALAEPYGLQITQVTPQPARPEGAYLVGDLQMSGRGTLLDFARFLDRLRRENACHEVTEYAVLRGPDRDDPRCNLTWTLRLYLLPEEKP